MVHDAPPEVDLEHGILGPYRDVWPLRSWKHGTVYTAVHPLLHRRVLLRVLAPEHLGTAIHDEFLRVGRGVAAIDHPNVAGGVLEAAAHPNVVFVAEEEPTGEPLDGFLPRTRRQRRTELFFPNQALAQAVLAVAAGLDAIHNAGLVHGHLSPECLRRGSDGRLRITGLHDAAPDVETEPHLSTDGRQRDLVDLGMAFAELVTGSRANLEGHHRLGVLGRQLRRHNPGLSRALACILEHCLTADVARRFRSARELAALLKPLSLVETRRAQLGRACRYRGIRRAADPASHGDSRIDRVFLRGAARGASSFQ